MQTATLMLLPILLSVMPVQAEIDRWSSLRSDIQSSVLSADAERLHALSLRLEQWTADDAVWANYWQAYVAYRLANVEPDDDKRKNHLRRCVDASRSAIDAGEMSGEARALQASCLGRLAGGGMLSGMRYGSRASAAKEESLIDGPDNPRVLLLAGSSDFYTPVQWGGDIDRAERRLRRALEQLETPAAGSSKPWQPQWGRQDAYIHLAQVLHRLDRTEEALALLDRAVEQGLDSGWLQTVRRRIKAQSAQT
ncbi:MAG: hypothetical protein AAF446_00460 [Pseudomonadota bacterium]